VTASSYDTDVSAIVVLKVLLVTSTLSSKALDDLWNWSDAAESEKRFRTALVEHPDSQDEIRTQIARALGLQRKFEEGFEELKKVRAGASPILRVRLALELGRLHRSSGKPNEAKPHFQAALREAKVARLDFYAIDAAHMIALIVPPSEAIIWHEEALRLAKTANEVRAQDWQGSVLNNLGWTYHDLGKFEPAFMTFQQALAFRKSRPDQEATRVAEWCVARTLRSLGKHDQALEILDRLAKGPEDGYVFEELAENLEALGLTAQAKNQFKRAFELLSQDDWLMKNEAPRMERLRSKGSD